MSNPTGQPTSNPTALPTSHPTQGPPVRIGIQYWLYNSSSCIFETDVSRLAWANVVLGVFVLGTSLYLNRFKITPLRALVDMCAVGTVLVGSLYLAWFNTQSLDDIFGNAFYLDLGLIGIGGILVQIPDDMIFALGAWQIYKKKVHWFWWCFLFCFVLIVNYISWVPQYTIFPFFLNTNTQLFNDYYLNAGTYVYTIGEVVFFISVSITFIKLLYDVNIKKRRRVQRQYQIFAAKCCIHMCSSSTAVLVLFVQQDYLYGVMIYNMHILISLHLLFNANALEYLFVTLKIQEWSCFSSCCPQKNHNRNKFAEKSIAELSRYSN